MSENFNQISTHENNHFKESITILDSKKKSLGLNPEDFFDENTKSIRLAELIEEKKVFTTICKN